MGATLGVLLDNILLGSTGCVCVPALGHVPCRWFHRVSGEMLDSAGIVCVPGLGNVSHSFFFVFFCMKCWTRRPWTVVFVPGHGIVSLRACVAPVWIARRSAL